MFVEKQKSGKSVKFYLAHSFRDKGRVRKIRKYLGVNLSGEKLKRRKEVARKLILEQIDILNTEIFNFALTDRERAVLNGFDKKLKIVHLTRKEWDEFKDEFVFNTNAIEGSTLALEEVKELIDEKPKVRSPEEVETLGVAKAIDFVRKTNLEISLSLIKKLHRFCFDGSKSFAGKFRDVNVVIRDSRGKVIHTGTPKEQVVDSLRDLVKWHNENKKKFKPLVLAALVHNQFEYIHPFQDGNGRVGRILLNYILLRNKYPPINILLEDRREYYECLKKYSSSKNLKPMMRFLIKQYNKTTRKVARRSRKR